MIIQLSVLLLILISGSESSISSSSRILGNHYHNFVSGNSNECFKTCLYDRNCKSATFEIIPLNCYLFNKTGDLVKDNFFTSFFKNAIIPSITANNTRLLNHYNRFDSQSQPECVQKCQNDLRCIATTFQVSSRQCYLYDSYEQKEENGWISFFKPSLPLIKTNDPRFVNSKRLFNHYRKFQNVSLLECAQRCLNEEKCQATTYDFNPSSCYFYDEYEEKVAKGWTSFFKRGVRPSLITQNLRYYQYYDVKIVDTQSDCFALCRQDKKCITASFKLADDKCFLQEIFGERNQEPGWISYLKKVIPQPRETD